MPGAEIWMPLGIIGRTAMDYPLYAEPANPTAEYPSVPHKKTIVADNARLAMPPCSR